MTSFQDQWGVTWEVQKTIPGAKAVIVENTGRAFRSSGRPIVDAVFYDGRGREICRREGMRLRSKKGSEYVVCRREPDPPAPAAATADDVFEDEKDDL